jgi:hypothetical protein
VIVDMLGIKNQQSHGILDPEAPMVEAMAATGSNIKQLAEFYLKKMQREPSIDEAVA